MSQTYVSFKKYPDAKQARAIQELLLENGVECIFVNNSSQLGSLSGEGSHEYELKLHPENFEKAEELLQKDAENMIKDLPEDYYLLSFSNEELHEVVVKHYEWSEFDYMLARRLLAERGHGIDETQIKAMRAQEIQALAKPEGNQKGWILAGYLFAILGGFFGVIIGYVLMTSRKTLPDGNIVHTYDMATRNQGKMILMVSLAVMLGCITLFLIR